MSTVSERLEEGLKDSSDLKTKRILLENLWFVGELNKSHLPCFLTTLKNNNWHRNPILTNVAEGILSTMSTLELVILAHQDVYPKGSLLNPIISKILYRKLGARSLTGHFLRTHQPNKFFSWLKTNLPYIRSIDFEHVFITDVKTHNFEQMQYLANEVKEVHLESTIGRPSKSPLSLLPILMAKKAFEEASEIEEKTILKEIVKRARVESWSKPFNTMNALTEALAFTKEPHKFKKGVGVMHEICTREPFAGKFFHDFAFQLAQKKYFEGKPPKHILETFKEIEKSNPSLVLHKAGLQLLEPKHVNWGLIKATLTMIFTKDQYTHSGESTNLIPLAGALAYHKGYAEVLDFVIQDMGMLKGSKNKIISIKNRMIH